MPTARFERSSRRSAIRDELEVATPTLRTEREDLGLGPAITPSQGVHVAQDVKCAVLDLGPQEPGDVEPRAPLVATAGAHERQLDVGLRVGDAERLAHGTDHRGGQVTGTD